MVREVVAVALAFAALDLARAGGAPRILKTVLRGQRL
jgi:hypothetical protein